MKKAFSLIEISIVILVIGIAIAGITQSSRLVKQTKLSGARTLTQSSPLASIKDLEFWLESTSENSFKSSEGEINNGKISSWYSLNPQSTISHEAAQATSSKQPTYIANGINGLPSLQFDGSQTYFQISYKAELNPTNFTFFTVIKPFTVSNYGAVISSRTTPFKGYMLYAAPTTPITYGTWIGNGSTWGSSLVPTSTITLFEPSIIATSYDGSTLTLYDNGVSKGSSSETFTPNTSGSFRIGAGKNEDTTPQYFFNGYISEIIIFSRVLKSEERQEVEKYLSKKWAINLS